MREIHRWSADSPHKGLATLKNDSMWWRHHAFPAWSYPDTSVRERCWRSWCQTHTQPNTTPKNRSSKRIICLRQAIFLYAQLSKSNRLQNFRDISYDKCIRRFCNDKNIYIQGQIWTLAVIHYIVLFRMAMPRFNCTRIFLYIPIHFWWRCSVGRQTYSNHLTPTVRCAGSVRFSLRYRME